MADATATQRFPTDHITLSDGTTTIPLLLADGQGQVDPRAIQSNPFPRTSLKFHQGTTKYGDFEPPYFEVAQDDWSGGMGSQTFDEDVSRYQDGSRVDTLRPGRVILGGQMTYGTGLRLNVLNMPGSVKWTHLRDGTRFLARSFSHSTGFNTRHLALWVRRVGSPPGSLRFDIYDNVAGSPGSSLVGTTVGLVGDHITQLADVSLAQVLTGGVTYWIVVSATSNGTAANHFEVGVENTGTNAKQSSDGTTWGATTTRPYFKLIDTEAVWTSRFYTYKRALYMVKQYDDQSITPKLYINGDRGAADSNAGNLNQLIDATQTWLTNEWTGAIAIITKGPGSEEEQNWRVVQSNTATALTVSPDWNTEHTTSTEYVIVGSNKWTQITGHGLTGPITGVAVSGDFVYFAQGEDTVVRRMQEYNSGGVWTRRYANEAQQAVHLQAIQQGGTNYIWGSRNNHPFYGVAIWQGQVPLRWGNLRHQFQELAATDTPFDANGPFTNVTQGTANRATTITVDNAFTTGTIAEEKITATDITKAKYVSHLVHSTVALSANDLRLVLHSTTGPTDAHTLNYPAINANEWTHVEFAISPIGSDQGAADTIDLLRFSEQVDVAGTHTITIFGGIILSADSFFIQAGRQDERITGLELYADPANNDADTIFVLKEGSLWRLDTVSNKLLELPLREFFNVVDARNGRAHAVGGVFLYFSLLNGLERLFGSTLDDIGPNRVEGDVPFDKVNRIMDVKTYPGRVLAATEEAVFVSSGGDVWHPIFVVPALSAMKIRRIALQAIPGDAVDRLWIATGRDDIAGSEVFWIPFELNPPENTNYRYAHEGWLVTGWQYAGLQDVQKLFKSLTIFAENLSAAGGVTIRVDYQLDDDATQATKSSRNWTEVRDAAGLAQIWDTVPSEEINLTTTTPPNITGRRVRFRLRMLTENAAVTPKVQAVVTKMLAFVTSKDAFTVTVRVADRKKNLQGQDSTTLTSAQAVRNQLNTWANGPTALTVRSNYSLLDNKTMIIDPNSVQPLSLDQRSQYEEHLLQFRLIEI